MRPRHFIWFIPSSHRYGHLFDTILLDPHWLMSLFYSQLVIFNNTLVVPPVQTFKGKEKVGDLPLPLGPTPFAREPPSGRLLADALHGIAMASGPMYQALPMPLFTDAMLNDNMWKSRSKRKLSDWDVDAWDWIQSRLYGSRRI
ncbi:hypothetical protein CJ030_MR8G002225 [Morella rubra]|uniref:Uncharacterized protein n=1 Tax=Morella rubra TaxID=262757 RepID=A0A6A1UQN5_9ROSI|nr:hypothetical protein CJ030_MR8G002225 [Morella rubra]